MCDNRIFGRGVRGTCLGWGSGRAFSYRVPGASQPGWARCRKRGQHRGVKSSPSMSHRPLWGTRRPSANVHYWGGKLTQRSWVLNPIISEAILLQGIAKTPIETIPAPLGPAPAIAKRKKYY